MAARQHLGGVDRLAFSALMELTPDGDVVKADFAKTVIRSRAALTYHEAQVFIDDEKGAKDDGDVAPAEPVAMAATPRPGTKAKSMLTVHVPSAPAAAPTATFSTPSRPLRRNSMRACRSAKKEAN